MTDINSELVQIRNTILNSVQVLQVYLFGSFAYGNPTSESDFDIYVVIPDGSMRPLDAMTKINAALFSIQKRPVDILVGTQSQFNKRKKEMYIEREVFEKGVTLYAA
ncbi:MAG: nucleotidyltransferase domain-containing protein [Treponema sp.]|nr:nucleotidyltransferase domain-containing protein [Treponema sp.]